jgi:hypothetical protein
MYRAQEQPRPPTTIIYTAQTIRPGYLFVALFALLVGLAIFSAFHLTHFTCRKVVASTSRCHVSRYAMVHRLDEDMDLAEIATFDVKLLSGSKGARYAEVRLIKSDGSVLPLETGGWGHVSPDLAFEARSQFERFRGGVASSVDAWISLGFWSNLLITLFGCLFSVIASAIVREQLVTLRPVTVVVDHARSVIVIGKKEVPFAEITDVTVESGRALFWSSGKNEHVPGFRLLFLRQIGPPIPATKEFRAGERKPHEDARRRVLQEIGRAPA